mmetsp:Transcript_40640/g.127129  ORF Transcript_40640/g.127129 Transcript_40640/m.127129 type:complete len:178 (-) Transcript_40640:364-897(-)
MPKTLSNDRILNGVIHRLTHIKRTKGKKNRIGAARMSAGALDGKDVWSERRPPVYPRLPHKRVSLNNRLAATYPGSGSTTQSSTQTFSTDAASTDTDFFTGSEEEQFYMLCDDPRDLPRELEPLNTSESGLVGAAVDDGDIISPTERQRPDLSIDVDLVTHTYEWPFPYGAQEIQVS